MGQRRGLRIAYTDPLYVIRVDPVSRTVWVGEEAFLLSKGARPIGQVYGGDFVDFYEAQKPVPPAVATSLALIRDARKKTASR